MKVVVITINKMIGEKNMPIIDFKEIPSPRADRSEKGQQDTFELFARDFLEMIGYEIISVPNRGPDDGKDLIVRERRHGIGGETELSWLVSCKHLAHSGKSVSPNTEKNILDRVRSNSCDGFLAFYSTLPSSSLNNTIEGLIDIERQIYDREKIERNLLGSSGIELAKRYFPISIKKWQQEQMKSADIMVESTELLCDYTGTNLLEPEPKGIIVFAKSYINDNEHFEDIYWCLKGEPDEYLRKEFERRNYITAWEDIPDVIIPPIFLKWCFTVMNELRSKDTYSDIAFDKLKKFLLSIFPYVSREMTTREKNRIKILMQIPSSIGGMG